MRVPVSNRTLLLCELITPDPLVAEEPAGDSVMPDMPITPWLFEVSPAALLAFVACPVCRAPPAAPVVVFARPPALDVTPPNAPRPADREAPAIPLTFPLVIMESSAAAAAASAWELEIA